jgi:hypothetical protein
VTGVTAHPEAENVNAVDAAMMYGMRGREVPAGYS